MCKGGRSHWQNHRFKVHGVIRQRISRTAKKRVTLWWHALVLSGHGDFKCSVSLFDMSTFADRWLQFRHTYLYVSHFEWLFFVFLLLKLFHIHMNISVDFLLRNLLSFARCFVVVFLPFSFCLSFIHDPICWQQQQQNWLLINVFQYK